MTTSRVDGDPQFEDRSDPGGTEARPGRALVIGTGLIGGSVGMALRQQGWYVSGVDQSSSMADRACELGALSAVGDDPLAEFVVVATPVRVAATVINAFLTRSDRRSDVVVTDVGGAKGALVAGVDDPAFVGGHPMAGSEQSGVEGARADLFVGASWVLTPTETTDPHAYARVRNVVAGFGARVVALTPEQHDSLVAVVSHVPHLAAATLMDLAATVAERQAALLPLAAGGFRDMTRVAAGHPGIWPDICEDNAGAIVGTLDLLIDGLEEMRRKVAEGDRSGLLAVLERASTARRSLSERAALPESLAEVRIPVPDRPGVLADVTTLSADIGVNIVDLELAHSFEGDLGVLVLVVDASSAPTLVGALDTRGYRSATVAIGPSR